MDLKDQLQKLFPDHQPLEDKNLQTSRIPNFYNQASPLLCKYEKRNVRPTLIIEGFEGENINNLKKFKLNRKKKFTLGEKVKKRHILLKEIQIQ